MKQQQSITTLPLSPDEERRSRMIKYSIAMGVRFVCFAACFFVQGWWLILPVVGAIVLPYFAVVLANVHSNESSTVVRPGTIVRVTGPGENE